MLEISEKDILKSLERDNPWWLNQKLTAFSGFTKKRAYFDLFSDIALDWDIKRSVILMGPRRVGKTVLLQQFIEHVIEINSVPSKNIFFASIDTPLYSGLHLEKLIQLFEKHTKHSANDKRLIIFDEIQYLKDWEVHLKVLTDKYPNTKFIASGSAAAKLKLKSQESGAGRFTDFFLPPITFAEFLRFSDLEEELIEECEHKYEARDIHRLNEEFIKYLNFGGYPEAILNTKIQEDTQRYLGRDIIDKVLLQDLPSLYGIQDITELNRFFSNIAYHSGQEINLESLASSSGVAKNTINKYLEYLEASFLIVRVKKVDNTGKTFKRARNFKIYLTNPSMRAALFSPIEDGDDFIGAMVETAIFSQWFHSKSLRNLYYARWKKGRTYMEADLVMVNPATLKPSWAYEIKWSDRFASDKPAELVGLIELAKKNMKYKIVVAASTKTISKVTLIDGVEIRHLPCALLCYNIGKNIVKSKSLFRLML